MAKINLVWLGNVITAPDWRAGDLYCIEATPRTVHIFIQQYAQNPGVDAWCFWDEALDPPEPALLKRLLIGPADIWHAGLLLGTGGRPEFIDFVNPTWMLNRDPDASIEATSWRMSFRCCLIRAQVLRQLGGPLPEFRSLDAAALDMGYRFIRNGVFIRHVPRLLEGQTARVAWPEIPVIDQLRFVDQNHGMKWVLWACMRAVLTRTINIFEVLRGYQKLRSEGVKARPVFYRRATIAAQADRQARVTVLIPTINRYPYLRTLLGQLCQQTIKPCEVIVVDQTPVDERDYNLEKDFADLPLRLFHMDVPGQCSSRNLGIQSSTGDYLLLLDDDVEATPDLIEQHLLTLSQNSVGISNGVVHEVSQPRAAQTSTCVRISDVFPAGNTMLKKYVLNHTGLFDLAYDRGQRADADLGTRIYLSGEMMVLNPGISLLHHHAPQGGLREHNARVHTYAASRMQISVRALPSVSDFYRAMRYYTSRQIHERMMLDILGTFSARGSALKKAAKVLVGLFQLPHTHWMIGRNQQKAEEMLQEYPQIPAYQIREKAYAASDSQP